MKLTSTNNRFLIFIFIPATAHLLLILINIREPGNITADYVILVVYSKSDYLAHLNTARAITR